MRILLLIFSLMASANISDNDWIKEKHQLFDLKYTSNDIKYVNEYEHFIEMGLTKVQNFFNASFIHRFEIVIYPDRASLDSVWRIDWKSPAFKSECWMVAGGVASKLDLLSPHTWNIESCEHNYLDTIKTQQLFTHELVHVFHGQLNASPDFNNIENLDWFVEGLATYVSGQCDSLRLAEIKNTLSINQLPKSLDNFWTGKLRYAQSGFLVMFIDFKYGREKLKNLLIFNKKTDLLRELRVDENELIAEWIEYIRKL